MNRMFLLLAATIIAAAVSTAQSAELTQKSRIRENIAVTEFEGKGVPETEASIFTDFLRTGLVNTGTFNVVEKANMDKLLKEVAFQQSGLTSTEDAVKIGKLLSVRKMVLGSVSKLKNTYYVTAKLVDVESSKIDRSETLNCASPDEFPAAALDLAERFSGAIIIERTAMRKKVWIILSPKVGYFIPLDTAVTKHYNAQFSFGADLDFLIHNNGISFDYEQYDDDKTIPKTDTLYTPYLYTRSYLGPTVREKLYLKTLTMNYLHKFSDGQNTYWYTGVGIGKTWSKLEGHINASSDFLSYNLKIGLKYKSIGAVLKYTYTPTNTDWSDVNFHGIALFANYNFTTDLNLY